MKINNVKQQQERSSSKIFCLGVSYPDLKEQIIKQVGTLEELIEEVSSNRRRRRGRTISSSVVDINNEEYNAFLKRIIWYLSNRECNVATVTKIIYECVQRKIITEMDGRDMMRCYITEQCCAVNIYTTSLEEGCVYRVDRHLYSNFNKTTQFINHIEKTFGHNVQFEQIILDYFWIPNGWNQTHWHRNFIQNTLIAFVQHNIIKVKGNNVCNQTSSSSKSLAVSSSSVSTSLMLPEVENEESNVDIKNRMVLHDSEENNLILIKKRRRKRPRSLCYDPKGRQRRQAKINNNATSSSQSKNHDVTFEDENDHHHNDHYNEKNDDDYNGIVVLPFCFYCFKEIVSCFSTTLCYYYNVKFLYKHECSVITLWYGTQQINPFKMQTVLGKQYNQEDLYCTFTMQDVTNSFTNYNDASCHKLMSILNRLENFADIRFIVLEPILQDHNNNVALNYYQTPAKRSRKNKNDHNVGQILGLVDDPSQVQNGILATSSSSSPSSSAAPTKSPSSPLTIRAVSLSARAKRARKRRRCTTATTTRSSSSRSEQNQRDPCMIQDDHKEVEEVDPFIVTNTVSVCRKEHQQSRLNKNNNNQKQVTTHITKFKHDNSTESPITSSPKIKKSATVKCCHDDDQSYLDVTLDIDPNYNTSTTNTGNIIIDSCQHKKHFSLSNSEQQMASERIEEPFPNAADALSLSTTRTNLSTPLIDPAEHTRRRRQRRSHNNKRCRRIQWDQCTHDNYEDNNEVDMLDSVDINNATSHHKAESALNNYDEKQQVPTGMIKLEPRRLTDSATTSRANTTTITKCDRDDDGSMITQQHHHDRVDVDVSDYSSCQYDREQSARNEPAITTESQHYTSHLTPPPTTIRTTSTITTCDVNCIGDENEQSSVSQTRDDDVNVDHSKVTSLCSKSVKNCNCENERQSLLSNTREQIFSTIVKQVLLKLGHSVPAAATAKTECHQHCHLDCDQLSVNQHRGDEEVDANFVSRGTMSHDSFQLETQSRREGMTEFVNGVSSATIATNKMKTTNSTTITTEKSEGHDILDNHQSTIDQHHSEVDVDRTCTNNVISGDGWCQHEQVFTFMCQKQQMSSETMEYDAPDSKPAAKWDQDCIRNYQLLVSPSEIDKADRTCATTSTGRSDSLQRSLLDDIRQKTASDESNSAATTTMTTTKHNRKSIDDNIESVNHDDATNHVESSGTSTCSFSDVVVSNNPTHKYHVA